jgi:hypothetical protein
MQAPPWQTRLFPQPVPSFWSRQVPPLQLWQVGQPGALFVQQVELVTHAAPQTL